MVAPISKHYQNEIGTVIIVNTGGDISSANVSLKVKKPSGAIVEWIGTVTDVVRGSVTFTDYGIRYVVIAGDFNEAGIYCLQAFIDDIAGEWPGNNVRFRIFEPFDGGCA